MQYLFIVLSFVFSVLFLIKKTKVLFLISEFFMLLFMYFFVLREVDFDIFLSSLWLVIFLSFFFYSKMTIVICNNCSMVNRKSQGKCFSCNYPLSGE
ncbi:membrane hypothetical protein [Vibrio crassostreae]|nr:membrane hypothetical protein [Vibrio crassostreae]CAK2365331.1 membrane hypothetical protein [Vibrio crassostreae]CAK3949724.1 membrane hypothetical protein [Vibrio crassostreae]